MDQLRRATLPLNRGPKPMPALGFGTAFEDPQQARASVRAALEAGFRHIDCAEQHQNEAHAGAALQDAFVAGAVGRDAVFVSTKLWNSNHRPERVRPACEASLRRLGLARLDLYLLHTPFAFLPVADDPCGAAGGNSFDFDVSLSDTWRAMEELVDDGLCGAIGLANVDNDKLDMVCREARIPPSVVQVEAHPYLPQDGLLAGCRARGIVLQAYAPLGHAMPAGPLHDAAVAGVAKRTGRTPAQVLLSWALQRGTAAVTSSRTPERIRESAAIAPLPDEEMKQLTLGVITRRRLNRVTETGVPLFALAD